VSYAVGSGRRGKTPLHWRTAAVGEDPAYLQDQLVTCIGNKRLLLGHLDDAVEKVKALLGKDRLRILDAFAGSGVVARSFKRHANHLIANDLEPFAAVTARCYLRNRSEVDLTHLTEVADRLNREVALAALPPGFIEELYAPADDDLIQPGERVFYTRENARRLDNYRRLLNDFDADDRLMLLGPLLSEASIHANTAGVFKGFYKDRRTGVGRYGGTNGDALHRIKGVIQLAPPVLSRFECAVEVYQEDANEIVRRVGDLDLAYFDPPYNQHPYGSNYFMLNLLVDYERPDRISQVSGIPVGWRRSGYNRRPDSLTLLADLVGHVDTKFILLSFNDEGFVRPADIRALLNELGSVEEIDLPYNTFRGSRNLRQRKIHVNEHLFLVERS
jgi:adenine-specific DNA-methyltransferase